MSIRHNSIKIIGMTLSALLFVQSSTSAADLADYVFTYDHGDYTYFDSKQLNVHTGNYNNFTVIDNDNYIELARLNYKDPDRSDRIYMEKSTEDECKIRINLTKSSTAYSSRTYQYYMISAELQSDIFGADLKIVMYDKSGNSEEVCIDSNVCDLKDPTSFAVYADFENMTADMYIGGIKCQTSDISSLSGIYNIEIMLINGIGVMCIDDLTVKGMENPYDKAETRSDIFGDFADEKAYLQDKTAVCAGVGRFCRNGEFLNAASTPFAQNGDVYISEADFAALFECPAPEAAERRTENGITFVPLCRAVECMSGKFAAYHQNSGLIIVSDEATEIGNEDWIYPSNRKNTRITRLNSVDCILNYLIFERPDAERLDLDYLKRNVHPRLMLTAEKVDELNALKEADPRFSALTESFLKGAEVLLGADTAKYTFGDDIRMKYEADKCVQRIMKWGLAWNLTHEGKYVKRAWEDLKAIADFPDYNVATIHDSAEFNLALAIGYDWLYDGFTDRQREYLERAIAEHSLKPLADGYYGGIFAGGDDWSTFKWSSNLNAVANAGAILAAGAVYDVNDESADIISKAIRSLEYTMIAFAPAGGWNEGLGYWNYMMSYLGYGIETIKAMFGTDYGLCDAPGFSSTADFAASLIGICGANNFGDYTGGDTKTGSAYAQASALTNNGIYIDMRAEELLEKNSYPYAEDIIFYPVCGNTAEYQIPKVIKTDGVETFTFRNEEKGMYFSTHFGATSGYHIHNDTGTFVLDMLGERWAEDLGAEDYALENFYGYKEWQIYRKRAEGHNCLIINPNDKGYEQKINLFVPISNYGSDERGAYVNADLSEIYEGANAVNVDYLINEDNNNFVCEYTIDASENANMYWFMHTKARITLDGNDVVLTKNGKSVRLTYEVTGADSASITSMRAQSLFSSLVFAGQNTNEAYRKIAIRIKGRGNMSLKISISPDNT